jgi:hypothetical protein
MQLEKVCKRWRSFSDWSKRRKGDIKESHTEREGEIVERGVLEIAVALSMTGIETMEEVRSDQGILKLSK